VLTKCGGAAAEGPPAPANELEEFLAEVLPDNAPMLKVFERCGLAVTTRRESGVVHVRLALSPGVKT
jgi:hypothetical protein